MNSNTEKKKWLRAYIKGKKIMQTELEKLAADCGCVIKYIPPYFPECDPVEYVWSRVKPAFKKTNRTLHYSTRLSRAYSGVDEAFIRSQVARSIRWCRERHLATLANDAAAPVLAAMPEVIEDSEADSEASSEADSEAESLP